ncbi:hypothetical protein HRG_001388 [Hirsutella rhossiliensis]|uniref:Uncharacterized protein n=1 Tax=Hirsutella rhossiliensis TaxID=111463 RepID=A0A9P8SN66_9HYPO|nr:uncharacterized protein HRG_01388 [Hirsutella rhossiliensis]KAH0968746.1 hypothetical protein HRG_01388 [Hirsutella rhossiliensis]
MQRVLEMLAKMGSEMVELKHRVSEQSDTIRKLNATVYKQSTIIQGQEDLIRGLEAQVQKSKEEFRHKSEELNKEMKQEHRELKRELVGVEEQLDQLMQKLDVSDEVALPSGPRATFADVARALPNSPPSIEQEQKPLNQWHPPAGCRVVAVGFAKVVDVDDCSVALQLAVEQPCQGVKRVGRDFNA